MIRLPAALERRLAELFPRVRERERFVVEVLKEALTGQDDPIEKSSPTHIGGTLHLFTDGGSRGNPGQAAIGCVLEDPSTGTIIKEYSATIGEETNNVAEYKALIAGLELAKQFQPNRLVCHLDSELIVKQLNGQYRVKMPTLKEFVDDIQEIVSDMPDVIFTHIPRKDNFRADALVNKALDADDSSSSSSPKYSPQQRLEW